MKKSAKYDKILALDVETSGINFKSNDPSENYQIVSIGLIVADTDKFNPIEELYLEIKWNKEDQWDDRAESIHCLSRNYLENNAMDEKDAVEEIALFLDKHFGIDHAISCLGQNVGTFDVLFLKRLLKKYKLPFKFAARHLDTFSLSISTVGAYSSDELFNIMGFENRTSHNSLDDAKMALRSVKIISKMWKDAYG